VQEIEAPVTVVDLSRSELRSVVSDVTWDSLSDDNRSIQWNHLREWPVLREVLLLTRELGGADEVVSEVPWTTLQRFLKKIQGQDEVLYQNCVIEKRQNIMLNEENIELLQDEIISCDRFSNGVTSIEAVDVVDTSENVLNMQAKKWGEMLWKGNAYLGSKDVVDRSRQHQLHQNEVKLHKNSSFGGTHR